MTELIQFKVGPVYVEKQRRIPQSLNTRHHWVPSGTAGILKESAEVKRRRKGDPEMKKGRFAEEQIIGVLKQHEAGRKVQDLAREIGVEVGNRGRHADRIAGKRPHFVAMMALAKFFDWSDALVIVKPETFLKWHRTVFKMFGDGSRTTEAGAAEEYPRTDSADGWRKPHVG